MEAEIPEGLRLKWTEAGRLIIRGSALQGGSRVPSLASSSSSPALDIRNLTSSIANIRSWCQLQRSGPQARENLLLQLNIQQQRVRSSIQEEEAVSRAKTLASQGALIAKVKAIIRLMDMEAAGRAKVASDLWDFVDFAKQKEPEWRRVAQNKAAIRQHVDYSLKSHRAELETNFRSYTDFLVAAQFQEREDRDVAYTAQLRRQERESSEAYARQYEAAQLKAQREAELKRLQAVQQQQQLRQQQQQQPRYGYAANNSNFAMPPPGMQATNGTYNYNHGPGAGQMYGGYPGNVRR